MSVLVSRREERKYRGTGRPTNRRSSDMSVLGVRQTERQTDSQKIE